MKDYYAILEVSPDATQAKIKEQQRLMLHAWHPDKFPNAELKEKAEEKTKQINEAYDILSNPTKRAQYDRERDRSWSNEEERNREKKRAEQERRQKQQADEEQPRTEQTREQARQAEEQRRRDEQERWQKDQAEEKRQRDEYERQQRIKAEAVRVQAEKSRQLKSLTVIALILLFGYLIASNSQSFSLGQDQGTVSGDVVSKTGIPEVHSEFDVWVKNDANRIKYVTFVVTGQ